jgi:tetratricopeptide (TPR) repeat protein
LPILQRADSLKPGDVTILEKLGSCYAILEDYEHAEVYFDRCHQSGAASSSFFHKLATVKSRLGKTDSAERYYREALTLEPDHRDCLQALSMLYLQSGRYPDAIASFERAIAVDSAYAPAWIGLGATYALYGQNDRSDSILHRLFDSDSTLGFQMLNLYREHKLKRRKNSDR